MSPKYLLYHACDPADCRQYTNVQLNTLSTALFMARALNRTLVLPPFMLFATQGQSELYNDGGHHQRNAYYRSFGTYFNVSLLQAHADVIEWDAYLDTQEERSLRIGHLLYSIQTLKLRQNPNECVNLGRSLLGLDGGGGVAHLSEWRGAPVGTLLGARAAVVNFQCGKLDLNRGPSSLERWLTDYGPTLRHAWRDHALVGALGEWHGSTNYADELVDPTLLPPPVPSQVIARRLEFNDDLHEEARAFVRSMLGGAIGGYVSVHWRHGDYQQWRKQAAPDTVAAAALDALRNASVPSPWRVFLATNCRDERQLAEAARLLHASGATLVRFAPAVGSPSSDDLPRAAFVEQLIASYAAVFLYTASSFFSHTIVQERRQHARGPSVSMHGSEQRMDFEAIRQMDAARAEAEKLAAEGGPSVPMGPGSQKPIFEMPTFQGAAMNVDAKVEL